VTDPPGGLCSDLIGGTCDSSLPAATCCSVLPKDEDRLEAAQDHALAVERHFPGFGHSRVGKHTLMRPGTRFPVGPNHPGQDNFLARLGVNRLAIVGVLAVGYVELPILKDFQHTGIFGNFGKEFRYSDIIVLLLLGNSENICVDVRRPLPPNLAPDGGKYALAT